MIEMIEGEFAFGVEFGNAYVQKKNGEIVWLDQIASQFYNHGPVRITIETLPDASDGRADKICPVTKKSHPIYAMTYRCNLCGKDVMGDGYTPYVPPRDDILNAPLQPNCNEDMANTDSNGRPLL